MFIPKGYVGVKMPAAMVAEMRRRGITDEDFVEIVKAQLRRDQGDL